MLISKDNPFIAPLIERRALTHPSSEKKTFHLAFDLKGSGLTYRPGDSVGICPQNAPSLVEKTLAALEKTGEERVIKKEKETSLKEALTSLCSISSVSPKLFASVAQENDALANLLLEENREQYKSYVNAFEVWDFLLAHRLPDWKPQDFVNLLQPLLPRFYSISSSQAWVGEEVHLTIAPLEFTSNGHTRRGVCTHYLCDLVPLHAPTVPLFIQPAHAFSLPEDPHAPLIMVGPGTGVAPFRAFLQERQHHNSTGKHWLFFGAQKEATDFLYSDDWQRFAEKHHLKLDLAFSRDQENKVYVQHKMWQQGEELFDWLEKGASLYVCGDASRMAKDVDATLHEIVATFGKKDPKEYVKTLKKEKRYLRDVY